jgi:hypothetical protein
MAAASVAGFDETGLGAYARRTAPGHLGMSLCAV